MLTGRIYQWARVQPDRPALAANDQLISYATFARLIEAARRFFSQQQLPASGTAIVLVQSLLDSWVISLGLRALGLNTIAVQLLAHAQQLHISDLACIVVTEAGQSPELLSGDFDTRVVAVPAAVFAACQSGELPSHMPASGSNILYTSGTTGIYKKLLLDGAQEDARNEARALSWQCTRDTVLHGLNFPPWTGAGFKQPSAVWHAGGCVIFDQRNDRFQHFLRYRFSATTMIEPMLRELLQAQTASGLTPHPFRLVFGAGFLSLSLAEQAHRQLSNDIHIHYGCTELATCALYARYTGREDLNWMTPAADRTLQIVDAQGMPCAVGEQGELGILVTDIDAHAYLDDAETSARVFRDGYFYPGDLAVARADGRIRILGRSADVLNVRGTKTAVAPMEALIQQQLGIDEVCLFAGQDQHGEEELVVAISAGRMPAIAELQALHPNFKLFQRIRIEMLPEFPRAESGMRKVQRAALRKLLFPDG